MSDSPTARMGNSEVGHLQYRRRPRGLSDLVKINKAIADKSILNNDQIKAAFGYARENDRPLHLMGLVSDGGVHSSLDHLFALLDIAAH